MPKVRLRALTSERASGRTEWRYPKDERRGRAVALLVGLTAIAFALGVYRLAAQSLGFDEGFSVYVARMPLLDELRYLSTWDAHPPLHYFLLHCWIKLAGSGEFALRLSSVAPSVLLVPLTYQVGRKLAGGDVGLFGAAVAAPSPFLAYYSHQARMYGLATALVLLTLFLVLRSLEGEAHRSPLEWVALALAAVASLYTLYYTAFVLLFAALLVLAAIWRRGKGMRERGLLLAPYAAVAALAALLVAPWLPVIADQGKATGPAAWRTFVDAPTMLARTWLALSLGHSVDAHSDLWSGPSSIGFALLALLGLLAGRCPRTTGSGCHCSLNPLGACAAYLAVPLAAIQIISYFKPIYNERYVLILLPAFALMVGLGLSALARRSGWLLMAGLMLVAGAYATALFNFYFDDRFALDDYRAAVRYLEGNIWPGDVVLLSSGTGYPVFGYYFETPHAWRGPLQEFPEGTDLTRGPALIQIGTISEVPGVRLSTPEDFPQSAAEVEYHLGRVARVARRIWYVRMIETVTDGRSIVRTWLDRNAFELDQRWFRGPSTIQVYLFTTRRPPVYDRPATAQGIDAAFENGAALVGFELTPIEPQPGRLCALTVYWQSRRPISEDYQVFVHLVDRNGQKWAQFDGPPLQGRYQTTRWQRNEIVGDEYAVRLPSDLPPGVYHFVVGMYDLATGQRVAVAGRLGRDAVDVGEVTVHPPPFPAGDGNGRSLATFGDAIALQGYRLGEGELRPGAEMRLDLTWKALSTPVGDYKVFVHLLGADGTIAAQEDSEPLQGRFPTSRWRAGDVLVDSHRLRIPAEILPGDYRMMVGLYEPATLLRLAVEGSNDDRVLLGEITVHRARE